jgi:hypothetical protein
LRTPHLATAVAGLTDTPARKAGQALRSSAEQEGVVAVEAFTSAPRTLRAQTVHDLKGESRDVVLVVADRLRSRARGAQGAIWSRPLLGDAVPAEDAEELRIAFRRPNPGATRNLYLLGGIWKQQGTVA